MVDEERIARAVVEILAAIGEDPEREGLRETPARVARWYAEIFSGLGETPEEHLSRSFPETYDEMVLVRDIPFVSLCEHHLLPFSGRAHIAYIPAADGRVLGLSKLVRLTDVYARRPQVQERLTAQVAQALAEATGAKGVLVVFEAEHLCMVARGVRRPGTTVVTSAVHGLFRDNAATRAEAMALIRQ